MAYSFGRKPMEEILSYLIPATIIALVILIFWKAGSWAISDAQLRGVTDHFKMHHL